MGAITYYFGIKIAEKPALGEKLESLQEALNNLPPAHYQTLKFLMAHLYRSVFTLLQHIMC